MDTNLSIETIEVAIAESDKFNYLRNLVVYNVTANSTLVSHECDVLVMSKAGYLTEIEIKRSWSDFLADFKKKHNHIDKTNDKIKHFYYCVPLSIVEKVKKYLFENDIIFNDIITYDDDAKLNIVKCEHSEKVEEILKDKAWSTEHLWLEQQFTLARYGAMRSVKCKQRIANNKIKK